MYCRRFELISSTEYFATKLLSFWISVAKSLEETLKLARIIASKSTATVAIGKEAFYKQLEMGIEDAYKYTSKVMSSNMLQQDAQEGISAFIENRDPIWSDS